MKIALFCLAAIGFAAVTDAAWQDGSNGKVMWDSNCDFAGHDLAPVGAPSNLCGNICVDNTGCTHWAWNDYQGGTCWLKTGSSNSRINAQGVGCGYVKGRFTPDGSGGQGIGRLFDRRAFDSAFPEHIPFYNYDALVQAASAFPKFANSGNTDNDKREVAAFLAQTAHESDKFRAVDEYHPPHRYCDPTWVPCADGRDYHGRGPIQLSWNYNYKAAGNYLGIDLWSNPDAVGRDSVVAWKTGLWYWMTPQGAQNKIIHDVINAWDGFAQSTDIINGALECRGGPSAGNQRQRIEYYKNMCNILGIAPGAKLEC
ncbi:TPA: hypothetical protein N0F65_006309 [Lagenidium giganteum]|uniref:Glycoside hydrolase family 19 catalytic domain-containing protein n=1 Tax=Lagenidium giganteum TaxID=4803 RepID=A0AAV2YQG3_9STRA|nr:TPA: hypothetical protein N0F65_006309 [Lagenidium giganteum]